jgi:hypothetical protein
MIGEFSAATGYSEGHLRELEDQGVVMPLRTPSGVRLYHRDLVAPMKERRERNRQHRAEPEAVARRA